MNKIIHIYIFHDYDDDSKHSIWFDRSSGRKRYHNVTKSSLKRFRNTLIKDDYIIRYGDVSLDKGAVLWIKLCIEAYRWEIAEPTSREMPWIGAKAKEKLVHEPHNSS